MFKTPDRLRAPSRSPPITRQDNDDDGDDRHAQEGSGGAADDNPDARLPGKASDDPAAKTGSTTQNKDGNDPGAKPGSS